MAQAKAPTAKERRLKRADRRFRRAEAERLSKLKAAPPPPPVAKPRPAPRPKPEPLPRMKK